MGKQFPTFYSTREIREKVDAYFQERCGTPVTDGEDRPVLDKQGRPVMMGARPPTVTGLALALGFSNREGLLQYPDDAPFAKEICRARMRAEDYLESQLVDKDKYQGAKFDLFCNFGWPNGERSGEQAAEAGQGVILMPPVEESHE